MEEITLNEMKLELQTIGYNNYYLHGLTTDNLKTLYYEYLYID